MICVERLGQTSASLGNFERVKNIVWFGLLRLSMGFMSLKFDRWLIVTD